MVFRTYTEDVLIDSGVDANLRSYEAAAAVLAGQAVKLDPAGDGEVLPTNTEGELAIGFAVEDAAAGDQVTIARDGCKVRATSVSGTIESGDPVTPTADDVDGEPGEVETATPTTVSDGTAAGTLGSLILGFAVRDDEAAHGNVVVEVDMAGRY